MAHGRVCQAPVYLKKDLEELAKSFVEAEADRMREIVMGRWLLWVASSAPFSARRPVRDRGHAARTRADHASSFVTKSSRSVR